MGVAQPCGGKRGLLGTRVSTFIELSTNSRKTCEAANGIMEKVFIYFSKAACEDLGEAGGQLAVSRD